MSIGCFLDTNMLIHAALGRTDERPKYEIARQIIKSENFALSGQVLAEFYVEVACGKVSLLTGSEIDRWMAILRRYTVVAVDDGIVGAGIAIARRFQIHYYDAAIVAAAESNGAGILYTEDLNHGQRYGSVLAENPFRDL